MPEPLSSWETRQDNSPRQSTHDPYLEEIANGVLTSPVPDYASTLLTQAEQDVEDENLRFLRGELSALETATAGRSSLPLTGTSGHGSSRRRYSSSGPPFNVIEDRVQEVIEQEYSDWAPGAFDSDDEDQPMISRHPTNHEPGYVHENDGPGDILRNRMRWRRLRDQFTSQVSEDSPRQQGSSESAPRYPSRFVENGMGLSSTESSLRTQAMLQAVRQNTQMSPRSRNQLQRFILDRERTGLDSDRNEQDRTDSSPAPLSSSQRRQTQQESQLRQQIQQNRNLHAEYQSHRNHLEEQLRRTQQSIADNVPSNVSRRRIATTPYPPSVGVSVENAVRYLETLRLCESEKEGRDFADQSGFNAEELCSHNIEDFLLDTASISPPAHTSWLEKGRTFSGYQHAVPPRSLNHTLPRQPSSRTSIRHPTLGVSSVRPISPVRSPSSNGSASSPQEAQERVQVPQVVEEHWPVKVTIHAVDLEDMTLSGTMEASEVPDKRAPTKTSNITTYLEGEVIDFNKYTLETKSFKANSRVDGVYWRKLPPFKGMKDEDTVTKCLLSKEWLERNLMQNWVLMRWKEKHFVSPSEDESSLTINGFYYVSIRRSDGHVEGLYYDEKSNPYQHLSLKPQKRTFPAYDFR